MAEELSGKQTVQKKKPPRKRNRPRKRGAPQRPNQPIYESDILILYVVLLYHSIS